MSILRIISIISLIMIMSCNPSSETNNNIDIQGHRGCRGNYPENTLIAFEKAITEYNVTTLEMDLCISGDGTIVVSHEPFFSHEISSINGKSIDESEELDHNLYTMDYDTIAKYDVGSSGNARFPDQNKIAAAKPRLSDVILQSEELNPEIRYNIEIKRKKGYDNVFHPDYKTFADLVVKMIKEQNISDRTTVQCFDIETLRYIHERYPEMQLVYLVEHSKDVRKNLDSLGFYPAVYSPYYKLLSPMDIKYCHKHNMQVIPWTINDPEDIAQYINMGIDGIITDYPDRVNNYLSSKATDASH